MRKLLYVHNIWECILREKVPMLNVVSDKFFVCYTYYDNGDNKNIPEIFYPGDFVNYLKDES